MSALVPEAAAPPWGLPRLLAGADEQAPLTASAHRARYGPLPDVPAAGLLDLVEASGLTGRGGAAFPTYRKLRAVAAGSGAIVAGNGAEGEPASAKDAVLLATSPHLVLDGLQLAARAVGARRAYLYLHAGSRIETAVRQALAERGRRELSVSVVTAPPRFLSGEESALAQRISGGPALPRSVPPRVFQRGIKGKPTLVQNVETLAHLALIARYGPQWFRGLGTTAEPGTALFTVGGAVPYPGVVEAPLGTPVAELLAAAGGPSEPAQAVLFGGYHGGWLPAAQAQAALLCDADLRPRGVPLGAGVVAVLPASACGVIETVRVVQYLAAESAGQCGPCLNGLPAIAAALTSLAGPDRTPAAAAQVARWASMVEGRGACHHPDGTVRFLRSAWRVFGREFELHAHGQCTAPHRPPILPLPPPAAGSGAGARG